MSRYIETNLPAAQDWRRELVFHELSQDEFQIRATDPQIHRKRERKFADPMVEKRRTHFKRMSHAHAVHFAEDVIGEVILEVEPEISFEIRKIGRAHV